MKKFIFSAFFSMLTIASHTSFAKVEIQNVLEKTNSFLTKTLESSQDLKSPYIDGTIENLISFFEKENKKIFVIKKYDFQKDIHAYIAKLNIQHGILIFNNTHKDVVLKIKTSVKTRLEQTDKKSEIIIVPSDSYYVYDNDQQRSIDDIVLLTHKKFFLNPKWTEDAEFELQIDTAEDKKFLYQKHDYDFHTKPFSDEEIAQEKTEVENFNNQLRLENPDKKDNELPLKITFKANYTGNYQYMDYMLKQENLSLNQAQDSFQNLYEANNYGQLLDENPNALNEDVKIPLITHKIWLTNPNKPVNMPEYYVKWFENSIKHNPKKEGWVHYLWIQDEKLFPELIKRVKNTSIKIMVVSKDLPKEMLCGEIYDEALANNKFGMASDVLRMEILRQFGGVYLDTDYELFHSIKGLNTFYNFYCAIEPMSNLICNAIVAASPYHPVIEKSLELIKRNANMETAPDYIKNCGDNGFKTIIVTGPGMITNAVALAAGQDGYKDIVFPSNILYPTERNLPLPNHVVVKPNGAAPQECFGGHYWETAWMRAEFGSGG